VLRLVGGVEQHLGTVGQVAGGRVQHDVADLAAHLRVTRLEGESHLVALLHQPVVEQAGLRRLARALAALEADEDAGVGVHPCTWLSLRHEHTLRAGWDSRPAV
jgi:hypothetical protein